MAASGVRRSWPRLVNRCWRALHRGSAFGLHLGQRLHHRVDGRRSGAHLVVATDAGPHGQVTGGDLRRHLAQPLRRRERAAA